MNSTGAKQYIRGGDLVMLRRILDSADVADGTDHATLTTRDEAARLLITLFENGISVEDKLAEALRVSITAPHAADAAPRPVATTGGYRFGRRVESNGTWTIYHVFSGVPAEYASWKMVGLNVKTAERALKILNAPAGARPAS